VSTGQKGVVAERPYRRLSPLTPLVRSFIFVVAVVSTSWDDLLRGTLGPLTWVLLVLLVAGAVYGTASWVRTKYWIEADELRVDTGVVSRQSRRIRIDRLQGVDIVQPLVARMFGLAELKMDVAGGSDREGSLAFMRLGEAQALKDLLLARRDEVRAASGGGTSTPSAGPPGPPSATAHAGSPGASTAHAGAPGAPTAQGQQPVAPPAAAWAPYPAREQQLARVDMGTLGLSILLSPETVSLLVAAAGFGLGFWATGHWAGLSVMVPVLGGLALVMFRRYAANYHFRVADTAAGLQVRRGLFELSSQTIALHRVQGIVVSEPWMWRPLGWARLEVSIAGYAHSGDAGDKPSASTVFPVGDRALVMRLARHVLRGVDPERVPLARPPARARWLAPVGWRFMGVGLGEAAAVGRSGWLNRRTHVVPHARVQSLRLAQGPLQRRLGLADLHVDSPPGPVHLMGRHRAAVEARGLLERERELSRDARARLVR
jgi:putative membrane protein